MERIGDACEHDAAEHPDVGLVGDGVDDRIDLERRLAAVDAALPQTQCTRCGYDDCRQYAAALTSGAALVNRCPPGGAEGIVRLAGLTGMASLPLDPACGVERPRQLAVIDEAACIGCRLCLKACPVDAILGGPRGLHVVMAADCTGCELCLPSCPVDCISLVPASGTATGWAAWSPAAADRARRRYHWHRARRERDSQERAGRLGALASTASAPPSKRSAASVSAPVSAARALVDAALARARARAPIDEEPGDA